MTPERGDVTSQISYSAIDPAVYSADTTPVSIDVRGAQRALLVLSIAAGGITFTGTNKIEFVLTHSDDNAAFTNVTDSDVIKDSLGAATITNGIIRALTAAHAAGDVQQLSYIGGKPYLKLLADFSGTHGTGTGISATVVKSALAQKGVA